jgi:hypothetical protein
VIFAARGIMVSLAFFALLYSFLSLLLVVAWRCLTYCGCLRQIPARVLFGLRVAPFVLSAGIAVFLTFPSFLLFEVHSMDEDLSTFVVSICGTLVLGAGLYRVLLAEARTRRVISACLEGATPLDNAANSALITPQVLSPLMLIGFRQPRILISDSARRLLSNAELDAAVRHEKQHSRSGDNLKKAILNSLPFAGMAKLERAWQEAAELAADDGAVSSRSEALDLAGALVKLSRRFPLPVTPDLATGLISACDLTTKRIEHLLAWKKSPDKPSSFRHYWILAAFAAFIALAVKLGPALALVHSLTERFVP